MIVFLLPQLFAKCFVKNNLNFIKMLKFQHKFVQSKYGHICTVVTMFELFYGIALQTLIFFDVL